MEGVVNAVNASANANAGVGTPVGGSGGGALVVALTVDDVIRLVEELQRLH
jgi:hypothetical protein